MNIQFQEVTEPQQIELVAETARQIWFEYYPSLITVEQVTYMVDRFQSPEAIRQQISEDGYVYFLVLDEQGAAGYIGVKTEGDKLFLSKLYLKQETRGKGYFNRMIQFIEQYAADHGLNTLYLTVNKYNDGSIAVYRKKGFDVVREVVADIGNGYVMDDYVMEKAL